MENDNNNGKGLAQNGRSLDKGGLAQDLLELGKFYFLNERYDEAIRVLQKAQKFNPSCAEIYYNLGLVFETENNLHEAKEMYLRAVKVDPHLTLAQKHLDRLVGK